MSWELMGSAQTGKAGPQPTPGWGQGAPTPTAASLWLLKPGSGNRISPSPLGTENLEDHFSKTQS